MYTVLWKEGDLDRWDRFETKEEVFELLKELREDPDAWCLEDHQPRASGRRIFVR